MYAPTRPIVNFSTISSQRLSEVRLCFGNCYRHGNANVETCGLKRQATAGHGKSVKRSQITDIPIRININSLLLLFLLPYKCACHCCQSPPGKADTLHWPCSLPFNDIVFNGLMCLSRQPAAILQNLAQAGSTICASHGFCYEGSLNWQQLSDFPIDAAGKQASKVRRNASPTASLRLPPRTPPKESSFPCSLPSCNLQLWSGGRQELWSLV